jgi:hypothetical protein
MESELFYDAKKGKPTMLSWLSCRGITISLVAVVIVCECLLQYTGGHTTMVTNTDSPELIETSAWQSLAVSAVSSDSVHLDQDGLIIVDGKEGWYELPFRAALPGQLQLRITYASFDSRPVRISLNGVVVISEACGAATGGFGLDALLSEVQPIWVRKYANLLRIDTGDAGYFPHIQKVMMRYTFPEPP